MRKLVESFRQEMNFIRYTVIFDCASLYLTVVQQLNICLVSFLHCYMAIVEALCLGNVF